MRCLAPIQVKNPKYSDRTRYQDRMLMVRCGKCEGCLKTSINNWAFRLEIEAKRSLYVHFVTLTYSPEFVPLTPTGLPTLDKQDVQKFFKRLRKNYGRKLKYFIVGEYGTRSYRPHYHAIIFNVDSREEYYKAWSINGKDIGSVHVGSSIDDGAIPYTLKYMYKKGLVPAFKEDDRIPEFRMMSKKLGSNYLSKEMINWHLADMKNRQYVVKEGGIKAPLPRYYREKIIEAGDLNREVLKPEWESQFMTKEDDDYRTLQSRIENIKVQQKKFERKRNQENRRKI